MPLNPNIPLGITPVSFANKGLEGLQTAIDLQARQQTLRDKQRAEQEQREVQRILEQSGGAIDDDVIQRVRQISPKVAGEIQEQLSKERTARANALKLDLENEKTINTRVLSLFRAIPPGDEEMYQQVRSLAVRLDPTLEAVAPKQNDPTAVSRFMDIGLTANEYADKQMKGLDLILTGKWREGAGTVLSTATDAEDWQEMTAGFRELGMPARELSAFGPWSPDAPKRAAQLSMSPKERAELAGQAAGRESLAADRSADNARMAESAASLDAYRGANLGLRRQEVAARQRDAANPQQRPLTQTAEAGMIARLSNQWTAAQKPMRELGRQVDMMDAGLAAARRGDMAQGNEVVLQTFLKVIDPTSVVREGEFWRLQQGTSLINRARAAVQRIQSGGWVPLPELEKYARLAHEIQAAQFSYAGGIQDRIGKTADRYNIPRELVIEGTAQPAQGTTPAAPAQPASGETPYQIYLRKKRGGK